MEFDNTSIKALREQIKTALGSEFDEDNFKIGRISYSTDEATITIKVFADGAEATAKHNWDIFCSGYDLAPSDFGREFSSRGGRYKIVGLKPNRPKYPIEVKRTSDGAAYKMPAGMVVRALNDEGPAPSVVTKPPARPEGWESHEPVLETPLETEPKEPLFDISEGAMF